MGAVPACGRLADPFHFLPPAAQIFLAIDSQARRPVFRGGGFCGQSV